MTFNLTELINLLGVIGPTIGGIFAVAWGINRKYVRPWVQETIQPAVDRTETIDAAVNHGRMERIEISLTRGASRMDRIETRLDTLSTQVGDRVGHLDRRIDGLTAGQTKMIRLLEQQEETT